MGEKMKTDQCPELMRLIALNNGDVCEKTSCKHNFFYKSPRRIDTKTSREMKNCMCNLDRALSLTEIGEMFGVSRERIRQIELRAIYKFLSVIQNKPEWNDLLTREQMRLAKRLHSDIFEKYIRDK